MTLNDVLLSLLEPMGVTGEAHFVTWDSVQQWPVNALERMLEIGILSSAASVQSVECQGCHNQCFMEVHHLSGTDDRPGRAFIVCDDPEMQSQMGRIQIPLKQLKQWKITALQLARVVASLLAIDCKAKDRHGQENIRIGMIKAKKGRRWLSLNKLPLSVEINNHRLPLVEALFFDDDQLTIDRERIEQLMTIAPGRAGKRYTPSTDKREARSRKTEAMYEDWREEYSRLRSEHPNTVRHTDSWIARQIAKQPIADGRSADTVRKHMKR